MDIEELLGGNRLFAGMGKTMIRAMAAYLDQENHPCGEQVFREGDKGDCYYIVTSGRVGILKGRGVARRLLDEMGPGDGFGEMALVSDEPRTATTECLTDTKLLRLDRGGFDLLMEQDPRFARQLLREIASRLRHSDELSTQELLLAHQGVIMSLADLAESRDPDTGSHLHRVRDYCTLLAKCLPDEATSREGVTSAFIEAIYQVSPLHDIGKVGIPDRILRKEGKLTDDEFEMVKTHTLIGARSITTVLSYCELPMFHMAYRLVRNHHEQYSGGGYPDGLKGTEIPVEARIMSVADVYDALRSKRPYKPPFSREQSEEIIRKATPSKFDPTIVTALLAHSDDFDEICRRYRA